MSSPVPLPSDCCEGLSATVEPPGALAGRGPHPVTDLYLKIRRRSDPRSPFPQLPFDDVEDSVCIASSGSRRVTAFISYSHETPEHKAHVKDLADRLRKEGVDCDIDVYHTSPPRGWPLWMQEKLQSSDFVIVVCTETYARRATGNEATGQGKGAAWEGRCIHQHLYEAGENRRVIPVVFNPADTAHIPDTLKGATYYDLSCEDGYSALHRALTNQPRVERPPLGPVVPRLPDLEPCESDAMALLRVCPEPLPREVVARVLDQTVVELETTLHRMVQAGFVKFDSGTVRLEDPSSAGIAEPSGSVVESALGAILDFIEKNRSAGRAQCLNVVELAMVADLRTASVQMSRTFRMIQSSLKSLGDKRRVLKVARRSIEASGVASHRGLEQVRDEAVAAICGVSWVYQRTGRLLEARVEAERSRKLGLDIHWSRNTAFCDKCLGRLARMEAEAAPEDAGKPMLDKSVELLLRAIAGFEKLESGEEVGDCYSLLARTHLVAGDRQAARRAIEEAKERLVDPTNKDYLDLQIVRGDLFRHINRQRARDAYSEVLAAMNGDNDAQKSEIMARAHLHRGRVLADLGAKDEAATDFRRAAEIWDDLEDPMADDAHWEIERIAPWMDKETKMSLASEPVGVRVRAARIIQKEMGKRPPGRSHREKLPQKYLDDVICRARRQLAVDRPAW